VYTFSPQAAGSYNVRVRNYNYSPVGSAPGYDLLLYVTMECPAGGFPVTVTNCIAAANRNDSGISEEITCLALDSSQRIYIFVDDRVSTNRGTTFQLEVTRCWGEREINSPRTNANVFYSDLSGDIDPINDVDFFALGTFPDGYRVFALLDSSAANLSGLQMRVVTTTNTLEFDDRDNDSPFGALSPNLAGTPLVGGPAYLRLTLAPNSLSSVGPYRLYGVVQPPQAAASSETEPNNTFIRANSAPNNYFYGTLPRPVPSEASSDVDVFGFLVEAGDLIFVSLDADPLRDNTPVDAALELLNESGSVVLQVDDSNWLSNTNRFNSGFTAESPGSPGEALVYRALQTGTYYARVSVPSAAPIGAAAGDYLLSIARNCFAGPGTNTPATVSNLIAPAVPEGSTVSLSGTVDDPDAGPKFRVVIDWGDGSMPEINTLPVGEYDFQATHEYAWDTRAGASSETYPLSILVFDNYGLGALTPGSIVISNSAPALSDVAVTSPVNSGSTATLTGNVADVNPFDPLRVLVNWGDGSAQQPNPLPLGAGSFSLMHTYNALRTTNYNISVVLQDDDGGSAATSTAVNVRVTVGSATFKGIRHTGSSVQINLQGTAGATYTVLASENLKDWSPIGTAVADGQGNIQFQDPAPSPNRRFYRAVWP
jgi:hypothetical protein